MKKYSIIIVAMLMIAIVGIADFFIPDAIARRFVKYFSQEKQL